MIEENMRIGSRVEYQTGHIESGFGRVTAIDEKTEWVTVQDEEDGSVWCGPADLATLTSD